jgi:hypothetical protein
LREDLFINTVRVALTEAEAEVMKTTETAKAEAEAGVVVMK